MIPLSISAVGQDHIIKKVGGSPEVKQHLADLGLTVGGSVMIVTELGGNLILNVKNSRIALSKETALKIMV